MKRNDPFFYNSRAKKWFFFGTPEDELTGFQVAYILSMDNQDIADYVSDDILVLTGRPFLNTENGQFYKKMFVIGGYNFFVNVTTGVVCRARGKDLEKFVYTD